MSEGGMRGKIITTVLASILVLFFVVGGAANMFASEGTRNDYVRWGYPDWFHYVTAVLELATAGLLAFSRNRLAGSALGSFVMACAIVTLLVNGEYIHALAPLFVLLLLGVNFKLTLQMSK